MEKRHLNNGHLFTLVNNSCEDVSTTVFESVDGGCVDFDDAISKCSSSMPDYLKMAMANYEVGSVTTDTCLFQESGNYQPPLDRVELNDSCVQLNHQIQQVVPIVNDYNRTALISDEANLENILRDVQLKIRPIVEGFDEQLVQLDKRIRANLNCCSIKEPRVEWLIGGHQILERFRTALNLLIRNVLDSLEHLLMLRMRGCDVASNQPHIDCAMKKVYKELEAARYVMFQNQAPPLDK